MTDTILTQIQNTIDSRKGGGQEVFHLHIHIMGTPA